VSRLEATILTELAGNALSPQPVLHHKSILTTASHYIKASSASGIQGLTLLEAHATSNKKSGRVNDQSRFAIHAVD
jgi:hypothetical protein